MGAWGDDLFQSDHDLDIVTELDHETGLYTMTEVETASMKAAGKQIDVHDSPYYTIYGGGSDPELVRKHLNSGVLLDLIEKKKAKLLGPPEQFAWRDPCYIYVLLGACAMTLGCQLPDAYIALLKKVYREGGLMPGALRQMKKALFGPDGYQNGIPYDFKSKGLVETANSQTDLQPNSLGYIGLNVIGPGGFFNTGMGDSTTSAIIKELRAQHNESYVCGGCGVRNGVRGAVLLQCGRCKTRRYCGAECQKKHWKIHKKVCEPVNA